MGSYKRATRIPGRTKQVFRVRWSGSRQAVAGQHRGESCNHWYMEPKGAGEVLGPTHTLQSGLPLTHSTSAPPHPPPTLTRGSASARPGPRTRGGPLPAPSALPFSTEPGPSTDFPAPPPCHTTPQSQHNASSAVNLRSSGRSLGLQENGFPSVPESLHL